MSTRTIQLKLPDVTADEIKAEAKRRGATVSEVIRAALRVAGFAVPDVVPGRPMDVAGNEAE